MDSEAPPQPIPELRSPTRSLSPKGRESLGDWLYSQRVPVPAFSSWTWPPHCGLNPRSAANINTEIPRYRDYNKKKTLLLCVSVLK